MIAHHVHASCPLHACGHSRCPRTALATRAALFSPPTPAPCPPPLAQAGCVPILHMRGFQKGGKLPDALEQDIVSRHAGAN